MIMMICDLMLPIMVMVNTIRPKVFSSETYVEIYENDDDGNFNKIVMMLMLMMMMIVVENGSGSKSQ